MATKRKRTDSHDELCQQLFPRSNQDRRNVIKAFSLPNTAKVEDLKQHRPFLFHVVSILIDSSTPEERRAFCLRSMSLVRDASLQEVMEEHLYREVRLWHLAASEALLVALKANPYRASLIEKLALVVPSSTYCGCPGTARYYQRLEAKYRAILNWCQPVDFDFLVEGRGHHPEFILETVQTISLRSLTLYAVRDERNSSEDMDSFTTACAAFLERTLNQLHSVTLGGVAIMALPAVDLDIHCSKTRLRHLSFTPCWETLRVIDRKAVRIIEHYARKWCCHARKSLKTIDLSGFQSLNEAHRYDSQAKVFNNGALRNLTLGACSHRALSILPAAAVAAALPSLKSFTIVYAMFACADRHCGVCHASVADSVFFVGTLGRYLAEWPLSRSGLKLKILDARGDLVSASYSLKHYNDDNMYIIKALSRMKALYAEKGVTLLA